MKIKKILISFIILVFFSFILDLLRPKIVIYGAPNNKVKVQAVMDFYDKYNDGEVSVWYVEKLEHSIRQKNLKPNGRIIYNYPLLYDKKGSKNFIIMYYINDYENSDFHRININADLIF